MPTVQSDIHLTFPPGNEYDLMVEMGGMEVQRVQVCEGGDQLRNCPWGCNRKVKKISVDVSTVHLGVPWILVNTKMTQTKFSGPTLITLPGRAFT